MEEEVELLTFFETIYGDLEGYVYLAIKTVSVVQEGKFLDHWYKWPLEKEKLVTKVLKEQGRGEVYYGPAIYVKRGSATKDNVKAVTVVWVDFDGNAPTDFVGYPEPTIIVQSSSPKNQHAYWKLGESGFSKENDPDFVSRFERLNRNLTFTLDGDPSGWDITQVLRPPFTTNHKRGGIGVTLRKTEDSSYSSESFQNLKEAPEPVEAINIKTLPDVEDVINKYKLKAEVWVLFKKGAKVGKRSEGIMALAYHLAELQLTNEEIMVMLLNADNRWGKFKGRGDQVKQLTAIISIARDKYPLQEELAGATQRLQVYGFDSLIKAESIQLEWIWDGFLQRAGYMLLTGAPKVGKTQFSLDFAISCALGEPFLDRPCRSGLRLGFLSLEMGAEELKFFLEAQAESLTDEQKTLLEEQFKLIPLGEPYYLNRVKEQDDLEELIAELKLDGIIIDSLGASIDGELTSEREARQLMGWNDRLRRRHDCFTWFIHHHRKANGDNKKPNKLADIYGSYVYTSSVTTAITLWEGNLNSIQFIPNAVRLSKTPAPSLVYRDSNLRFTTKPTGLTIIKKSDKAKKDEQQVQIQSDVSFMESFDY